MNTPRARCRNAALMAFYAFLLTLGAVLPFAASYQAGVAQPAPSEHVRCGGYRGEVATSTVDCDEAAAHPPTRPRAALVSPVEPGRSPLDAAPPLVAPGLDGAPANPCTPPPISS